jgi:hypothetical protein
MTENPRENEAWVDEDEGEIDDDFLFHLYQGGEFLRADRIVEAKEHLEKALELKPANPRGQNMLGLVYFKLGLFPQAVELYQGLVRRYQDDPTLRVNLAMVHLKAEELDQAESQLRAALQFSPDHLSAHRYLGLVLVRQGKASEARGHLERAGVRNLDRLLDPAEAEEPGAERQAEVESANRRALAEVAELGFQELETRDVPFRGVGLGVASAPASQTDGEPETWQALDAHLSTAAGSSPSSAERLFRLQDGRLHIDSPGRVYTRLVGLDWIQGRCDFSAVKKRFAGKETRHPFDRGERAMVATSGPVRLGLSSPTGEAFSLIRLARDPGYFVEPLVFAFSDTTAWENGRLPASKGEGLSIFHLFAEAEVVLCCAGPVRRQRLIGDERVLLRANRLVGWIGNLVPRLAEGEPPLPEGLWIELTGGGDVLLVG